MTRVCQVLYGGLGGHRSVAMTLLAANQGEWEPALLTYGIESLDDSALAFCEKYAIEVEEVVLQPGRGWSSWFRVQRKLARLKPELLILHSLSALLPVAWYCKKRRIPLVVVEHTANQIKRPIDWLMSLCSFWLAQRIVYLTDSYRQEVAQKLGRFFLSCKVAVISNGLNLENYQTAGGPPPERQSLIYLGMAGRFSPSKGQSLLLQVLAELRHRGHQQLRLRLSGSGPELDSTLNLCSELQLEPYVEFCGNLMEPQMPGFYRSLDLYVHLSLAETMSMAVMEAMASHLPVVVSDIPGLRELIVDAQGNLLGLTCPNQVGAVADRVELLLENPALARVLGERSANWSTQNYCNRRQFLRYCELVRELSSSSRN